MASQQQIKQYLAYWFQLGKKIIVGRTQVALLPQVIYRGDRYSEEFEQCWQKIWSQERDSCYLEGTDLSVGELLDSRWEIVLCARCSMPIPLPVRGMPPEVCPCNDLVGWPNTELPQPRSPVENRHQLHGIHDRLVLKNTQTDEEDSDRPRPGDSTIAPESSGEFPLCPCHPKPLGELRSSARPLGQHHCL